MAEFINIEQSEASKRSILNIEAAIDAASIATGTFVTKIEETAKEISDIVSITKEAQQSKADSKEKVARQVGIANLQTQRDTQKFFKALGGTENLFAMGADLRKEQDTVQRLEDELIIEHENELPGILGAIAGLFTDSVHGELNEARKRVATSASNILTVANTQTAAGRTFMEVAELRTEATLVESQNILSQINVVALADAELKALATNAQAVKDVYSANKDQLDNAVLQDRAVIQVEAAKMARIRFNLDVDRLRKMSEKLDKDLELARVNLAPNGGEK